jgi:hypothetical protein
LAAASSPTRVALLLMGLVAIAYCIWRWILSPLMLPMDYVDLAYAADRAAKSANGNGNGHAKRFAIAPRVATVLELPELLRGQWPPSPTMVDHAVRRSFDSLREIDFEQRLDEKRKRKYLSAIAGAFAVVLLIAVIFPSTAKLWAKRWLLAATSPGRRKRISLFRA